MPDDSRRLLEEGIQRYVDHLRHMEVSFNEASAERSLPIRMSVSRAVGAVSNNYGLGRVAPFWARGDDSGVMHIAQLRTAVACLAEMVRREHRCGHVVGAMQSGKTTTSFAMQFAGPALYLLSGVRVHPFYLIGNQMNHEDQTRTELDRFMAFYGDVELLVDGDRPAGGFELDALFERAPSLNNYRQHVLRGARDLFTIEGVEDLVQRRVGGERCLAKIEEITRRALDAGLQTLMIIDEPQFGAGDGLARPEQGQAGRRRCVLAQIFDRIEERLGLQTEDHFIVGLSATPFEINDLDNFWEVRQELTAEYCGFNFFNGRPITEGVDVGPPETMGLTVCSVAMGIPFLRHVSPTGFNGNPQQFERYRRKIGFAGDQDAYRAATRAALREFVHRAMADCADEAEPVGLCIRAFNDNQLTEGLIGEIGLDEQAVEVVRYFGAASSGQSIKRMIATRARPDLPYVVFVTNRARMADAFPPQVRYFLDLANKAGDLNALLQGLLGRACGYEKNSTVVLSDANAAIVDDYAASHGGYVYKPSRHSVVVGIHRRSPPTSLVKFRCDMPDEVVQAFFAGVDAEVVGRAIPRGSAEIPRPRPGAGFRTGPLLVLAERTGLFDHVERDEVRAALFEQIHVPFRLARAGDGIHPVGRPDVSLGYSMDAAGWCRFTFRWGDRTDARAQGGAQGRAVGAKDSEAEHMEPTVYVEKYDPSTGAVINDRLRDEGVAAQGGWWRAFMVTFPSTSPFREIFSGVAAFPSGRSVYEQWMTEGERVLRDNGDAR